MGALPLHIDENYILYVCLIFAVMCFLKLIFPVLGAARMTKKNLQDFLKNEI